MISAPYLADAVSCGLVLLDCQGRVLLWNKWMMQYSARNTDEALGVSLDEACGVRIEQRIHMAIREALDFGLASLLSHVLHPSPFPLFSGGGTERIKQSITINPVLTNSGERRCLIQINDVTTMAAREKLLREQTRQLREEVDKLTEMQEQLRCNESRFRELTRQVPVGIFETDLEGCIVFSNERCQAITGFEPEDYMGQPWHSIAAIEDRDRVNVDWQKLRNQGERIQIEFRCANKSSMRKFWVSTDSMPVRNKAGVVTGFIGTLTDIHDAKEAALRNAQQATFDTLTGLYNRTPFNERLMNALSNAGESHQFALMFIDLDDFKQINDKYGHESGDIVLKTTARRLRQTLRADDTVARFGGDEFVVMLAEFRSDKDLQVIVSKIERGISQPINIGICHVHLKCSIGTAVYPQDGCDITSLMRHSDQRMYDIKRVHHSTDHEENVNLKQKAKKKADVGALM